MLDCYTKFILTIIAVAPVWLAVQQSVSGANAAYCACGSEIDDAVSSLESTIMLWDN